MSYTRTLRSVLKDKNDKLEKRLDAIEDEAKAVLHYTASKFPYYTPHDFLHSKNVLDNLGWVIPDNIKTSLTDYELFILIVAAWLHDWGMVATSDEDAEKVREEHHLRTEKNFIEYYDKIHLNKHEARLAGLVSRGHRKENLADGLYDDQYLGANILVRPRFLAAALRIADECDATANRTPEIVFYSIHPTGASQDEFNKHLTIGGVGHPTPYKIQLNGVAYSPQGVGVIEGVKNKIQKEVDDVKEFLMPNGILIDTVETKIDARGFVNKPISFELDREKIVNLLIGSALYSKNDVAIREAMQNAIDTCRLKKILNPAFVPSIEVSYNDEKLSFCDNGMGMNYDDALKHLSCKGNSYYESDDLKRLLEGKSFCPIGKFGIGILSSFLIADRIIIETKKDNSAPCKFTINNLVEGWLYEESSKTTSGTTVTLFFNNQGKKINVEESLKYYCKNIEIPILLKDLVRVVSQPLIQDWSFNMKEVLNILSQEHRDDFLKETPNVYRTVTSDYEITYYEFDTNVGYLGHFFISNNGIYVGNFKLFGEHFTKYIILVNSKTDLYDLNISRETITINTKFLNFLRLLHKDFFSKIYEKCADQEGIALCKTFEDRVWARIGNIVDEGTVEFLFCIDYLLSKFYPTLDKNGLKIQKGEEIVAKNYEKIVYYEIDLDFEYHPKEHINLVSSYLMDYLKDYEIIIFDFHPMKVWNRSKDFDVSPLFSKYIIGKNPKAKIKELSYYELISEFSYKKEETALDALLPPGSFFAKMPEICRGLVVNIKPYVFSTDSNYIISRFREMFKEYPEIQSASEKYSSFCIEKGIFVYDYQDPLLEFILSNADKINNNDETKRLVQQYLHLLPFYFDVGYPETKLITLLVEKNLAKLLSYKEYISLEQRVNALGKILIELK